MIPSGKCFLFNKTRQLFECFEALSSPTNVVWVVRSLLYNMHRVVVMDMAAGCLVMVSSYDPVGRFISKIC